jgi:PTH1 family peptidyl-tRNA hydrolase
MRIICGLGNPGEKYEKTRHNAGFRFVDKFYDFLGWDSSMHVMDWEHNKKIRADMAKVKVFSKTKVLLVKPFVFMNKSGISVHKALDYFNVNIQKDFFLVHDDLDIHLGDFKIQRGTGPQDHNGVKSVEQQVGRKNFVRIRIGVDNREGNRDVPPEKYVLQKLDKEELIELDEALSQSIKALRSRFGI